MEPIKICIAGVTGWVGKTLAVAVVESNEFELVSAVSRKSAGKVLGEVILGSRSTLKIDSSVSGALAEEPDVLIDYTSPECVKSNVLKAIKNGTHVVVGTSGLADEDYREIHRAALENEVGVVAAGNFAISAALMLRFATIAARFLPSWEILDYASWDKIDSPSGTANELAFRISQVAKPDTRVPLESMIGPKNSRGVTLNGNQVHSLRLPGYVIGAEVLFGSLGERLTLKFDAGNEAQTYVEGTLLAARKVSGIRGLIRGLDNLLDL